MDQQGLKSQSLRLGQRRSGAAEGRAGPDPIDADQIGALTGGKARPWLQLQCGLHQLLLQRPVLGLHHQCWGGRNGRRSRQGLSTSLQRLLQSLDGDPSPVDRLADGRDGGVGIRWHQDQIGAGLKGLDGCFSGARASGDRLHHQRIGHDETVKAQVLAQQVGQHRCRQGGGALRVQLREEQMGRHHAVDSGFDQGAERWQFHLIQPAAVVGEHRQVQVGVAVGVAMAWEMFGATQHPRAGQTVLERPG